MSNKQKTAVEWLIDQVEDFLGLLPVDMIEKAKELEKQQMIEFANKCQLIKDIDEDGNVEFAFNPETHFNETFNPL